MPSRLNWAIIYKHQDISTYLATFTRYGLGKL